MNNAWPNCVACSAASRVFVIAVAIGGACSARRRSGCRTTGRHLLRGSAAHLGVDGVADDRAFGPPARGRPGQSWTLSALAPSYLSRPMLLLVVMAAALALWGQALCRHRHTRLAGGHRVTTLGAAGRRPHRINGDLRPGPEGAFRAMAVVSLPMFLIEGFFFLLTNADVMMVGVYLEPKDVAIYFATVKTMALVHFVYFAVKAGVAQRYAQFSHGEPENLPLRPQDGAWTFWPSLVLAILVLVLGRPMLVLFGADSSATAADPAVFGVVARAAVGPSESLLTMSGNQKSVRPRLMRRRSVSTLRPACC